MNFNRLLTSVGWIGLVLATILFISILHPSALADSTQHYTELEFPPPPEIKLPEYERYQLDNGMVVYLVEDRDLPLVTGSAIIHTGSRFEPSVKVGLGELVGTVMRSGGTEKHSAAQLNQILEGIAAKIETGIDATSGGISFNTLSEDLETVFNLFAEVIRYPVFAADQFELAKNQEKGAIARRNDDPGEIAGREFEKLIYGSDSPYARTIEYQTLDNITRADAIKFYQQYFRPDRTILGIVGDFDRAKMKILIKKTFGDWRSTSSAPKESIPTVSQPNRGKLFFIDRPQLTQSNVILGHLGGKLDSPDYPALQVLNGVLNGYGGRLFNQVRSRQGLAYSIYGYWNPAYDYPGTFSAGGQTRSNATVAMVRSILSEIDRIRNNPITPEELNQAKESMLNSFVFNFQSPSQTLFRLMRYEYYGYPKDFIFKYQRGIEATTIKDVQRVAQKYLQPDQIVTLVVGNSQQIQPPLKSLHSEIHTVDISITKPQQG